jgi:predicted lipoprotein with Yx(FWY)xxD motif
VSSAGSAMGGAAAGEGGSQGGEGGQSLGGGGDVSGGEGGEGGAPDAPNVELDPDPAKDTLRGIAGTATMRSLYFYGNDSPATSNAAATSACVGACVETWPVFHVAGVVTGAGLVASDFGELTRPDGQAQTTFKGWPLYFYSGDDAPADRNGEGVDELWHGAEEPFYSIVLRRSMVEANAVLHLAGANGKTIYQFDDDLPGNGNNDPISGCVSAGCRRLWPVVSPMYAKAVSSVTGAFAPFVRADTKAIQLAYEGWPLYFYLDDVAPGDVAGLEKTNWVLATP